MQEVLEAMGDVVNDDAEVKLGIATAGCVAVEGHRSACTARRACKPCHRHCVR